MNFAILLHKSIDYWYIGRNQLPIFKKSIVNTNAILQ